MMLPLNGAEVPFIRGAVSDNIKTETVHNSLELKREQAASCPQRGEIQPLDTHQFRTTLVRDQQ